MRSTRRQSQTDEWLTFSRRASAPTLPAREMISSTVIVSAGWNIQPYPVKHFVGTTNARRERLCEHRRMAKMTLGDRFRGLRLDKGRERGKDLPQAEAADAIGISRPYLGGIETDQDNPGRDVLIAAAEYYNVSVDWLATGKGDPRPTPLQERTARLIEIFESLDARDRAALEGLAQTLARRSE